MSALQLNSYGLREKCSYLQFFWSVFFRIRTEYIEKYGHFSRSDGVVASCSWMRFVLERSNVCTYSVTFPKLLEHLTFKAYITCKEHLTFKVNFISGHERKKDSILPVHVNAYIEVEVGKT